ncbi:MAG: exodeoxyribonuclease VII large subunit [bacterium]|nr:exodeoxyribonuclease VII large subunit [Candidatus Jorgensenbacteria bacterium]
MTAKKTQDLFSEFEPEREIKEELEKVFSVSEFVDFLNEYLKPAKVIVHGEIGEKMSTYPGFTFLNLLDTEDKSSVQCFVTSDVLRALGISLQPGMAVKIHGYPSVFKKNGGLNLRVMRIELVGEGMLKKQFEILKKKLGDLGLFDIKRKRVLPQFTESVGLITSKFGRGALKDFVTNLDNFNISLFLYPVKVEGASAVGEITDAIKWLNENKPELSIIVLARGGGSWESLQAFNSEDVVRAIAASKIPVLTGIGHEDDVTLADLVADFRASTPTHAAKVLSDPWVLARENVLQSERAIAMAMRTSLRTALESLKSAESSITTLVSKQISEPKRSLDTKLRFISARFQEFPKQFSLQEKNFFDNSQKWLIHLKRILFQHEEKLGLSSPLFKLRQGYTITTTESGEVVKDLEKLKKSDIITTRFTKGRITSKIEEIKIQNNG